MNIKKCSGGVNSLSRSSLFNKVMLLSVTAALVVGGFFVSTGTAFAETLNVSPSNTITELGGDNYLVNSQRLTSREVSELTLSQLLGTDLTYTVNIVATPLYAPNINIYLADGKIIQAWGKDWNSSGLQTVNFTDLVTGVKGYGATVNPTLGFAGAIVTSNSDAQGNYLTVGNLVTDYGTSVVTKVEVRAQAGAAEGQVIGLTKFTAAGVTDYTSIQDAITAATGGDIINVAAGTYTEQIQVTKQLTINGSKAGISAGVNAGTRGTEESIVNGGFYISTAADGTVIDGFTVQGGYVDGGHNNGFTVEPSGTPGITIQNNIIQNITSPEQSQGIETVGGANNLMIKNNKISNNFRGIYLNPASGITIEGNLINANNGGVGIASDGQSSLTISDNTISNQTEGWGSSAVGTNVVAHNNSFIENVVSVAWYTGSTIDAKNNWWGNAVETDILLKITGIENVTYDPWYIDAGKTTLSNSKTLTFDSAGGSVVAPITQDFGTAVTAPATPTKAGYTFLAWSPAFPSTMPLSETLTATWTADSETLTFISDGSAVAPITQDYGTAVTAPATPTKVGYTFAGWSPVVPTTMPLSETLTAGWTINTFTLTYSAGANGSLTGTATQTVNYNTSGTAVTAVPATGYHFVNWSDSSTANPRTDTNVTSNLSVTASFATNPSNNNGGRNINAATPAIPANEQTPDGCAAGNKFSTTTGRNCNAATPAVPAGQVLGASTQVGQVLGATSFNFTKLMKNSSKGNEVIELQKFLTALGYNLGTADGKFGAKTKAAVIKFQLANKLVGDGVVGPKVRALLNK